MTKTWFITGAGRGMGNDIAKAVLAAGHNVVATGRNADDVSKAFEPSERLLVLRLDVTNRADATTAVEAALDRFGRIDVLLNNAASFHAGFFEDLMPDQMESQLATTLMGPMNVTLAVLPSMRANKYGRIITISSTASLTSFEFGTAYSASKYGTDGFMEALRLEVAPFGIETMIVTPGFFRTELLTEASTSFAPSKIAEYAERREAYIGYWRSQNGKQSGDPAKLAQAILTLDAQEKLPTRFLAGADAVMTAEQAIVKLQGEIDAWRELSCSLDHDGAKPARVGENN